MLSIKIKELNTDKLLQSIMKDIEKDLKKNPKMILDSHVGDIVAGNCPNCGKTTIEILTAGRAKCIKCGCVSKVSITPIYK